MASVAVPRGGGKRAISIDKAMQQFDLLFDEYFDIAQPTIGHYIANNPGQSASHFGGADVLEYGEDTEVDEVYTDSHIDPEQKEVIHKLAKELANLGDQYSEQYGNDFVKAETVLTSLFTKTTGLEYKTFEGTLESLMGHDRNIAGFMLMMCVSKSVSSHVGNVATKAKAYFRRYIGYNYVSAVAESGGLEQFMRQT